MVATAEIERLLSPSQAARRLNMSSQRVGQMMSTGQLAYVQTALGRLCRAEDVEGLAQEREQARAARSLTNAS
jgi:hypothetical protein